MTPTMTTADSAIVANEQAWAAARLRGAAEALGLLDQRSPAEQRQVARFAVGLLAANVSHADWVSAGLPPAELPVRAVQPQTPVGHPAVLRLARMALRAYRHEMTLEERAVRWRMLADFFTQYVAATDPSLLQIREQAAIAAVNSNDTSAWVFVELENAVEFYRARDGEMGYLTSLARQNLAIAYRQRRTDADLVTAAALDEEEIRRRTARYGPEHPVTLAAVAGLMLSLILQAEASTDAATQRVLADRVLAEIGRIRVIRDRLFGTTAPNATRVRRYEARALLLRGEPERALSCLEYTLAFENAHNEGRQTQGIGQTHYLLARAYAALEQFDNASEHARLALGIFDRHSPSSRAAASARVLVDLLVGQTSRG